MRYDSRFHISIIFLCILASPLFLIAQGHKGKNKKAASETHSDFVVFSAHDQTIIHGYFRMNASNLPPGLANRRSLPPGLEKQLQKNGTLPPGLEKKITPFPPQLERSLTPLPLGYTRRIIGVQALILDSLNVIQDVILIR